VQPRDCSTHSVQHGVLSTQHRISSLHGSFVENQLGPLGRVVDDAGRLYDQLRHRLLLDHGRRAVVMNALEVEPEVDALPVRLAARRALVRALARVRLLVRLEMTELRVGIVADRTNVRFLPRMRSHVYRQRILVDECLQHTYIVITRHHGAAAWWVTLSVHLITVTWRGSATGRAFGLAISRSRVQILLKAMLRNNLRQVVYTYMPLSPSSITWYRPKGGDALRLGR